jgi:hypothetical protein
MERGTAILISGPQFAILLFSTAYLVHRRVALRTRLRRSWPAIVARLHPALGDSSRADTSTALDSCFSAEEIETRVATREGRAGMFREAGVMLEMADYAERNGEAEVAPVVARLRAHALKIRVETALSAAGFGEQGTGIRD